MAETIFYILAILTCAFALLTVTSSHVFHGAIWLSLCLLSISGVYFYLNADFVAVIQVLVYIGGIITLFIFAIKLTGRIDDRSISQVNNQVVPSFIAAVILFGAIYFIIKSSLWNTLVPKPADLTLTQLGESLMTRYALPFEFMSFVLLAVLIGAIMIGRNSK